MLSVGGEGELAWCQAVKAQAVVTMVHLDSLMHHHL